MNHIRYYGVFKFRGAKIATSPNQKKFFNLRNYSYGLIINVLYLIFISNILLQNFSSHIRQRYSQYANASPVDGLGNIALMKMKCKTKGEMKKVM